MTGTLYKLLKERRREGERVEAAAGKQSLWSKVGMGLGGLIAMGLTGGAATPLVAAMLAGGGTLAGGLLGRQGARQGWFNTDKAKLKGGRFYKDEAADLKSQIGESIWAGAAKAGLQGGIGQLTKGFSFGKEGLKFTEGAKGGGSNLADLWRKDAPAMAGEYSDSLWGKFGKAIDFKGSFAGKGLQKLQTAQLGKEYADAGWIDPNLQDQAEEAIGQKFSTVYEGREPIVDMDRRMHSPAAKSTRIDQMLQERGPLGAPPSVEDVMSSGSGGHGFQKGILPGHSKVQYDVAQAKNAELVEALKGHQFGPLDGGPQPTSTKPLSSSLDWRDAGISQYDEYGSWGAHVGKSPVEVSRELGEQGYGGPIQGESFPVTSPDFIRSDASRALGASQYSTGRISALDTKRHKDMLDSLRWQNRLFGD